jgi:hypothetical protein
VRFREWSKLIAAVLFGASFTPLIAHHSITAEFDMEKRVDVAGVVTRVEWMNPHTYFYVDAPNPRTHKIENWAFQLNSPRNLRTLGWKADTLKVGDVIRTFGSPALSGSKAAFTREIWFQDGRKLKVEFTAPGAQ